MCKSGALTASGIYCESASGHTYKGRKVYILTSHLLSTPIIGEGIFKKNALCLYRRA